MNKMFHTRDWAVYSVAVYVGLLFGGALIAPRTTWSYSGDTQPHHVTAPPVIDSDRTANSRTADPNRASSRLETFGGDIEASMFAPSGSPEA